MIRIWVHLGELLRELVRYRVDVGLRRRLELGERLWQEVLGIERGHSRHSLTALPGN